jgi:hypothetical protein
MGNRRIEGGWPRTRVLLVVLVALAPLGGCKRFKEGYDKQFKASFVREFNRTCTKGAVDKQVPAARAKAMCECMSQYLVTRHTTAELTAMSAAGASPEAEKPITAAGEACAGKLP